MKFLLEIRCRPENLKQEIEDKIWSIYEISLQLEYVGALPLSNGKVLIVYEFEQKRNGYKGELFVIKREITNGIGKYWIYSTLSAKICSHCKFELEEYMLYCPYCGSKTEWVIY